MNSSWTCSRLNEDTKWPFKLYKFLFVTKTRHVYKSSGSSSLARELDYRNVTYIQKFIRFIRILNFFGIRSETRVHEYAISYFYVLSCLILRCGAHRVETLDKGLAERPTCFGFKFWSVCLSGQTRCCILRYSVLSYTGLEQIGSPWLPKISKL